MRKMITLIALLFSVSAFAQPNVKQQAEQMGRALMQKDYSTFVTFTYPAILQEMGGAEKMAAAIEKQMKGMEQTAQIVSISYGEPSAIIVEGKELQCTLPQQMTLKTPQGNILSKSTLIALSQDEGQHWYFVDAGERDIAAVRTSLPNVSRKLVLPKPEPPQFVR
jgi:hypothetical protein